MKGKHVRDKAVQKYYTRTKFVKNESLEREFAFFFSF